jgi:hypothetical protein
MTQPATRAAWPWPDSLDAVIAAPQYHRLVLENDRVRVLDTRIPAGDIVPVHTHRWPAIYYTIAPGDFVRRDGNGNLLFDSRTVPGMLSASAANWIECLPPHSVENVSAGEIHLISVELKDSYLPASP